MMLLILIGDKRKIVASTWGSAMVDDRFIRW